MPNFELVASKNINGLKVSLYNFDLNDISNKEKLENELINKVQSMKIHEKAETYIDCIPHNILEKYKDKFNENIAKINPVDNRAPNIPHFSHKRSRVTEFIAQLLLAKKEFCIFYDEADKKILMSSLEDNAHVRGIDITGIRKDVSGIKFVACELKASKDTHIPCDAAESVLNDIKKAYNDEKERLSKEILQFLSSLKTVYENNDDIKEILSFLFVLFSERSSRKELLNKVLFIPFLIRQNENIVVNQNLDDFQNFNEQDYKDANIKGIILSFNTDVTEFSNTVYNKAIGYNE